MPKPETNTTTTAPEQPDSTLKLLIQQIENIKTTLKGVVGELHTALEVVKRAEKEKRLAEKEIEAIREKVREIQSVTI
jgi:exonuclease VII small subunit